MNRFNTIYQEAADAEAISPVEAEAAPEQVEEQAAEPDKGLLGLGEVVDRPEYMPEKFWNGEIGGVDDEKLAKSYVELEKRFGSFVGAPKDGYDLPEGVEDGDALFEQLKEFGTKSNMNQAGLDEAWQLLSTQAGVNDEISHEGEIAKLGDNAAQRIKTIENALKFKAGDSYDEIKGMITTADGVMLAEKLIKAFAPAKLPMDGGENPSGVTWSELEKMLNAKDEHGNHLMSVDQNHKEKYERLKKEWGGDKPNIVTVS